ncbi:C40 family peptidase [Escherichia coli]|uniref:C40 family peptidase n=1 Tax=Escherichia coli TaxID=562 RepID=UPI001E3E1801|nr:C40 family peptidase [Escherichia coli]MCC9216850.1 C40 family peptidase [Escherichia coli]
MTETESAILAHARRCAPAESCGFVVRTPEGERYFPCVNISGEPEDYFRMSPEDWLQAEMQGEIVALVHSHPGGLPWLSEADRRLQVPLSAAQPGDVLLCCFGSSVPNHAAIYCGDGELLHHIPEQLSKRERYTDKWQRRTHSLWRHRAWHASAFTGICNDLAAASIFV